MKYIPITLLIYIFVSAVSGCTVNTEQTVTPKHFELAEDMCKQYGGVKHISLAKLTPEEVDCGSRCIKKTGRFNYIAKFVCNNDAEMSYDVYK